MTYEDYMTHRLDDMKRLGNIGGFLTETNWNFGSTEDVVRIRLDMSSSNWKKYINLDTFLTGPPLPNSTRYSRTNASIMACLELQTI
jgi:hypothetical protein